MEFGTLIFLVRVIQKREHKSPLLTQFTSFHLHHHHQNFHQFFLFLQLLLLKTKARTGHNSAISYKIPPFLN